MAPAEASDAATALRRVSHKATEAIDKAIEEFRFNSAIATIHEWVTQLKKAEAGSSELLAARREGARMLAVCLVPFMPHLAEECWQAIGETGFASAAVWPQTSPDLLVETTVTLPIQINGKKRGEIVVAKAASAADIEKLCLEAPGIPAHIEGKSVKKVIVVPGRIVNIVVS